jgi:hypothetical protein
MQIQGKITFSFLKYGIARPYVSYAGDASIYGG